MNLVLGSTFDNKILDMFEFEVTNYIPIEYFAKDVNVDSCMKPVILFQGDIFETDFQFDRLRKFFIDFYRLHDVEEVNVSDLKRIIVVSCGEDKVIKLRSYQLDEFNEYNVREFFKIVQRKNEFYRSWTFHEFKSEKNSSSFRRPVQEFSQTTKGYCP